MAKSKSSTAAVAGRDPHPILKYFNATRAELRKVAWPTREETRNLTAIIVTVTIAMAAFLGLLDYIFQIVTAGIVGGDFVRIGIGLVLFIGGVAAFYFNNQE
jgi:preprotein translocase subunit SecE